MRTLQLAETRHGTPEVSKPGVLSGLVSKIASTISSVISTGVIDESEPVKNDEVKNSNFIGPFICRVGQYKCWEAKGEVTETFSLVSREIKDYLETHSEPIPRPVIWSLYIVGRTVRTAVPTIMFCCPWKIYRKRIRKEVEDSSILSRYPGFTTGDCKSPPGTSKLVPLGKGERCGTHLQVSTCVTSSNPAGPTGGRLDIRLSNTRDGTNHSHNVREATAGSILRFNHETYILTAGHAFLESSDFDQFELSDLDDELDIDEDAFDVGDGNARTTAPSSEGEDEDEDSYYQGERQVVDDIISASLDILDTNTSPLVASHLAGPVLSHDDTQPGLDYALLECGQPGQNYFTCVRIPTRSGYFNRFPETIVGPGFRSSSVLSVTSSGELLVGTINEAPSYLTSTRQPTCQELWTVRFRNGGRLKKGDCGSIVIDQETSEVYGHIICGDPEHGFAYVVPAYHVIADLRQRFGQNVELATISNTQNMAFTITDGSSPSPRDVGPLIRNTGMMTRMSGLLMLCPWTRNHIVSSELARLDKIFQCELRAQCEEFVNDPTREENTGSQLLSCLHDEILQKLLELDVSGNPTAAEAHRKLVTEVKTVSSHVFRAIELSALFDLSGRIRRMGTHPDDDQAQEEEERMSRLPQLRERQHFRVTIPSSIITGSVSHSTGNESDMSRGKEPASFISPRPWKSITGRGGPPSR